MSAFFQFASKASKGARPVGGEEGPVFSGLYLQNCLLLATISVVMSIINSSWLYTPIGWLDPWYNVAYFLHYSDPTFLSGYYKAARLPWIIPGFVAYHVFQPIVANYLLHMGCLIVSIAFFYLTVARLLGSIIAFATATCFVIFTPFHGSGGWDYQNAGAGAYYIFAFYLLTVGSLSGKARYFAWAGAAYAAAVHCSIPFINMVPILVIHCLTTYRHKFGQFPFPRLLAAGVLWFLFGGIILTILCGFINISVGRDFIFFKQLLAIVFSFVRDNQHQQAWWFPWSSKWYLEVHSLNYVRDAFAVLVACAASVTIALVRGRFNVVALSLQIQYILVAVLWIVWQSVGQTALQPDYFAYPIYPVMFFGLAGAAAASQRTSNLTPTTIRFCVMLAVIAPLSLSFGIVGTKLWGWAGQHLDLALVASALFFAGLFAVSAGRAAFLVLAALAFCASNALGAAISSHGLYSFGEHCEGRAGAFRAMIGSNRFVTPFVSNSTDLYVWWNRREILNNREGCTMRLSDVGASMTSFGLQYLAPPWSGMPGVNELPANSISAIAGSRRVVIPTGDYSNVEHLIARYGQDGIKLTVEGRTIIRAPHFSFDLYVLKPLNDD